MAEVISEREHMSTVGIGAWHTATTEEYRLLNTGLRRGEMVNTMSL